MTPQPPPLDATPFLNDEQQRELGRTPLPFRLLGAWLILIRDDYLGQWSTRQVPCVECVGQRLPCIDKVGSEVAARCEGCRFNGYRCSNGDAVAVDAEDRPALAERISTKKRKLELPDAGSSPAAVSSIDTKLDLQCNIDDAETLHDERPSTTSATSNLPTLLPAWPASLPPKPVAPLGIPGDGLKAPDNLEQVRSILENARRLARCNGRDVNVNLDHSIHPSDFQRFDATVLVRPPGTLPTWLVVLVDHKTRRGKVLFNDRRVPGRFQHPVQVCLERAFYIFHKSVSLRAEVCPSLDSDGEGCLHATALAVDFILNGPGPSGHELIVDRKKALRQHRQLLEGIWPPSVAVTLGRESTAVARISRHERCFEWVKEEDRPGR
ncbi:hypothetical protein A1Q2_02062 [Trichosporon asahii var. asahii CBS 8904]|uniref:Uncharacterized protein n=2 Tax=Trichosporon asahii var. asahii TaxID=189963 RepID=K1VHT5_TRIAC|nr:hypothetical protein A1Q1_04141 [Trichosporon asahii var. asahii CBS 2479]EJT47148.1 hypothetical protein A1Q1_04141 [Trichosporon asahii var. asahii CBS 2479]EKD03645.1 hypothetical protein A1Q2_02062 [Trichosporon asahii var. asahii CBS 8904]